jgi:hypothetical protein
MSRIISYKNRLADTAVEKINLSTNDGLTGYSIHKLELLPIDADEDVESVVKIFATDPGTATADINFADSTLLAAGVIRAGTGVSQPLTVTTVFENEKFNQNIFVTLKGSGSGYNQDINYYLELKESKLSLDEQTVATLTNIRNTGSQ